MSSGRHRLDEPRHRLPRPRPGAQRIDGSTIDVDDDHLQVGMVRAYAAIGRRRLGPLCCRRANGALRFVLTIDYGPSLPPTEIITGGLIDPILTRRGASRLPRAENQCAVRLQLMSGLERIPSSCGICAPKNVKFENGIRQLPVTSGLPRRTDMLEIGRHVSKVSTAEMMSATVKPILHSARLNLRSRTH